jgi:4-hydroxymandelate oxidase
MGLQHISNALKQFATQAETNLSNTAWQYLQSDAGQGEQSTENVLGWRTKKLVPRPLATLCQANTQCQMWGETWAHPIMLAPVAYLKLFNQVGEIGTAMACNAQQGQMMVSSLASQPLETIIEQAQQPLWFQLYWQGNKERTLNLLKKTLKSGYSAVVFTVDAPVKQAVFELPKSISAVNLEIPLSQQPIASGQSLVFDGWMAQAPTWNDVAWLRQQCQVPLLLKGIMHPDDAKKAVAMGCDGVVVSNHGGRVLAGTPSIADVLPSIVHAVNGGCKVIVDSGVRSGQDVFKALAMGADAVCVGRPYVWGLASDGALGVATVLRCLRDELEMTMALTGVVNLAEIKSSHLI